MVILTREQVRNLDRIAVERYGIPGLVLMENAGCGATAMLLRHLPIPAGDTVLIVAGKGNNGGDGFVIARHLANQGVIVRVALLGRPAEFRGAGEAGVNFDIIERMPIPIIPLDRPEDLRPELEGARVIVDAILGTGLTGEVRGKPRWAIEALNGARTPLFAVDTPSGLDCDTGQPLGIAVRAGFTATFGAMKQGLVKATSYTGLVEVVDIGCPLVWE